MIKVSPKAKRLLVPIVSVIAGFLVGAIIMLVWSYDPFQAYSSMFESALGSANGIGETIRNATPLIFIAIGFQISSAAGFFNIGLPGQAQAGWLTAIWIGLAFKGLPSTSSCHLKSSPASWPVPWLPGLPAGCGPTSEPTKLSQPSCLTTPSSTSANTCTRTS